MTNKFINLAFAASTLQALAMGCADSHLGPGPESPDLATELASQPSYAVDTDGFSVSAEASALRANRFASIDFGVLAGDVVLSAPDGDRITLVDLHVELDDVSVPADILPPNGVKLTNIALELSDIATNEARWSSGGNEVRISYNTDLVLHWATRRDDRDIPLGDIRVDDVPLLVTVTRVGSLTTVAISAERSGSFWRWADTFELRDLSMNVSAR